MLIPRARPRRASDAYWWLQGWRRTISLCSVCTQRGCSQQLCNMACRCVLQQQQTMKSVVWESVVVKIDVLYRCIALPTVEINWPTSNSGQARRPCCFGRRSRTSSPPFPACRPSTGSSRGLTLSLSHHRRRAVALGLLSAPYLAAALQCLASIPGDDYRRINAVPGLGHILGRISLISAQQRTAGLHNALLSALLIARFLSLVSAPSRGAR